MTIQIQQRVPPLMASWLRDGRLLAPQTLDAGNARTIRRATTGYEPDGDPLILGDSGPCPAGGTTAYIVLDESLSVASAGGNDPLAQRHKETALAIAHVASACRCGRDRVSLVPFDLDSPGHVPPQPLTRSGVRRLRQGLRCLSAEYGLSSSLIPVLAHIEQYAADRGEAAALVVFSDFLLTDPLPTDAINRLCAFPGSVHAVALGATPPAILAAYPGVEITRLTLSSSPGAAARAVFDGLTHYRKYQAPDRGSAAHRSQDTRCDRRENNT